MLRGSICALGLGIGCILTSIAGAETTKSKATASQPAAIADWNICEHIADPDKVIVQSHRGAGELAPENTLEAFELGWKLGCYPESDIRTTSDGAIVAFHDANFDRVVKNCPPELKGKGVADVTIEQLLKLDVGAWKGDSFQGRHVSRLTEVFALMRGKSDRHLYLDIKDVDLAKLASQVKEYTVGKQVILASTKYEIIREWKRLVPDGQTLLWMGGTEKVLANRFKELRETKFADVTQLQIHVKMKQELNTIQRQSADPFEPSDAFLIRAGKEIRERGILFQSLPWGGATPDVYWKLLDLGVMSFATDHPDVTRDALKQYYRAKAETKQ